MRSESKLRLYCFSPPVMLATFLIEIVFAIYVVWRYKMTATTRLITSILACLATFQAAEFAVCGQLGFEGNVLSRVGYGAITLLPPLGIHLAHSIAGKKSGLIVGAAYASAAGFLTYFVFMTGAITGQTCYANYAVFNTHEASAMLYSLYYYGWLLVGTFLSWQWAAGAQKHIKTALYALSLGYVSFIVPTTVVNIIDPSTISGIPSIMCGFAVILAFVLVAKVAPESLQQKSSERSLRFKLPF